MKILYISSALFPSEKSHSLSIMRLCQAFKDAGHEITLVGQLSDYNSSIKDPLSFYGLKGGFSVLRLKIQKFWEMRLFKMFLINGLVIAWKTKKIIKRIEPDIIYSRLTVSELALIPSKIPIIYEMHSLGPLGKNFFQRWFFTLLTKIKNFKKIIVTTNYLAEILNNKFKNIEIVVAKLSTDLPINISEIDLKKFKKKELMGAVFDSHVGYTGYLDTRGLRGTDIIIKSAEKLPKVAFHIVGGEKDIVEYWKKYSRKYNKNNNIFFYGHRNSNEMPYFLNCFDVTLAPLQYRPTKRAPIGENMSPLKLPQYLGYGKAIVASDIIAHRECLIANETAILVKYDSIEEWVNAIAMLLNNPHKRKILSQNAKKIFYSAFTHEIRLKNILSGIDK